MDKIAFAALRAAALTELAAAAWAMRPEALRALADAILFAADPGALRTAVAGAAAAEQGARIGVARAGGVAVIPVRGIVTHRASAIEALFGAGWVASCELIAARLRGALADPEIGSIVLDVDSPGGVVSGVPELAAQIFAAREAKPVVAVANADAGSAAYWLASQATELAVTPSGAVGSIGCWIMHRDFSGFEEQMGVKTTLVSYGEFKVEGHPFAPLSDEARAELQRACDQVGATFEKDVARGRGATPARVREAFGRGRMVEAVRAKALGMADRVATLDETVSRLAAGGRPRRRSTRADSFRFAFS